jgi:hypothetical protein
MAVPAMTVVTVNDLRDAADDLEREYRLMGSLGFPVPRRNISVLLRSAAVQLETLKAECWRLSQGEKTHGDIRT